jgi:hypothetical protein
VTADIGAMLSCAVTATNASGSATASSNAVGPITDLLAAIFGADDGFYPVAAGYVFTDTAGTVAASVDGDLIACFKPKYGGLPALTQATAANRPLLKDAGGGVWYALGDGTTDLWASATTITTATEQLLALASRRATQPAGVEILRAGTTASNKHSIDSSTTGRVQGIFRFAAGTVYSAITASNAAPLATDLVASSKLTATTIDIGIDQGTPASGAAVAASITSASLSFPSVAINADRIYGWALYTGTIGAAERSAIVSALAALQGRSI